MKFLKLISLLLFLSALNCTNKNNNWSNIEVDSSIKKDTVFKYLNKNFEKSLFPLNHKNKKKSTQIIYYLKTSTNFNSNSKLYDYYDCKTSYANSDTLHIGIGIENGFGSAGIMIQCKDNKFNTKGYFYNHTNQKNTSKYKVIHQNLVLDKPSYKVNDSIFGKIDFEFIETNEFGTINHKGKMYFRNKVTKSWVDSAMLE